MSRKPSEVAAAVVREAGLRNPQPPPLHEVQELARAYLEVVRLQAEPVVQWYVSIGAAEQWTRHVAMDRDPERARRILTALLHAYARRGEGGEWRVRGRQDRLDITLKVSEEFDPPYELHVVTHLEVRRCDVRDLLARRPGLQ